MLLLQMARQKMLTPGDCGDAPPGGSFCAAVAYQHFYRCSPTPVRVMQLFLHSSSGLPLHSIRLPDFSKGKAFSSRAWHMDRVRWRCDPPVQAGCRPHVDKILWLPKENLPNALPF